MYNRQIRQGQVQWHKSESYVNLGIINYRYIRQNSRAQRARGEPLFLKITIRVGHSGRRLCQAEIVLVSKLLPDYLRDTSDLLHMPHIIQPTVSI